MARKKKEVQITEEAVEVVETVKEDKVIVNTTPAYLFQVTALADDIKLYKKPVQKNPQGRMIKGQVYNVICEINYTPIRMLKLDIGYYIIADYHNIKKL